MTDESFNISENWQSPQDAPDALFRVDQVLRSRSSAATRTAAHPSLAIASCSSPASFIETCGTISTDGTLIRAEEEPEVLHAPPTTHMV